MQPLRIHSTHYYSLITYITIHHPTTLHHSLQSQWQTRLNVWIILSLNNASPVPDAVTESHEKDPCPQSSQTIQPWTRQTRERARATLVVRRGANGREQAGANELAEIVATASNNPVPSCTMRSCREGILYSRAFTVATVSVEQNIFHRWKVNRFKWFSFIVRSRGWKILIRCGSTPARELAHTLVHRRRLEFRRVSRFSELYIH